MVSTKFLTREHMAYRLVEGPPLPQTLPLTLPNPTPNPTPNPNPHANQAHPCSGRRAAWATQTHPSGSWCAPALHNLRKEGHGTPTPTLPLPLPLTPN